MASRNIARVKLNLQHKISDIAGRKTNRAIYAVLSQGQAMSALLLPIDTGFLLNSAIGPYMVEPGRGRVGYAAEYAMWVHNAPGTLKGKPRSMFGMTSNHSSAGPQRPMAFGGGTGVGNYWDPNAEPGFLRKGFEQIMPYTLNILKASYDS